MSNNDYPKFSLSFRENAESWLILLLSILFIAGFIFHNLDLTAEAVLKLTDLFLFIANSVVFYFLFRKNRSLPFLFWCISAFLITFFIEFIGVKTGKVFGEYEYGSTMFIQIGKVPVIIAFNWVMLILATYSMSRVLFKNRWIAPIMSSFMIVAFDFVMEPVAMYLDYWQWEGGIVPIQNYIAWFVISFVFSTALSLINLKPQSRILHYYFFMQFIFFLLFRIEIISLSRG
jgi:putative membrane protein